MRQAHKYLQFDHPRYTFVGYPLSATDVVLCGFGSKSFTLIFYCVVYYPTNTFSANNPMQQHQRKKMCSICINIYTTCRVCVMNRRSPSWAKSIYHHSLLGGRMECGRLNNMCFWWMFLLLLLLSLRMAGWWSTKHNMNT